MNETSLLRIQVTDPAAQSAGDLGTPPVPDSAASSRLLPPRFHLTPGGG